LETKRVGEVAGHERLARVALSFLADPGDPILGALLRTLGPADVLAAIFSDSDPCCLLSAPGAAVPGTDRVLARWRSRLDRVPSQALLSAWERGGLRFICPGEPEWPTQLDDLGDARPIILWLRGTVDLRYACLRSVAVVGSRAATAYGSHVCTELAATLAEQGWSVVSGGAFGIDACAHRGALASGGTTIGVLASGLTFGYPKGHHDLFAAIEGSGVMVSESPPNQAPTRPGFLIRNRLIAALTRGTVVVEAALRSGALNTARHARELNRTVMTVPGPVTSAQSAGCHELIREWGAVCVTAAAEIVEVIRVIGDDDAGLALDSPVPADPLDPVTASVLGTLTGRSGRGPATIATLAGVDLDTAMRCLGLLSAVGYVERCDQGWRTRKARSK
jgi:DNA processing protein